jgi:hypothetical protein
MDNNSKTLIAVVAALAVVLLGWLYIGSGSSVVTVPPTQTNAEPAPAPEVAPAPAQPPAQAPAQ